MLGHFMTFQLTEEIDTEIMFCNTNPSNRTQPGRPIPLLDQPGVPLRKLEKLEVLA